MSRPDAARPRRDAGLTLVEVLVVTGLLGLVMSALVGAVVVVFMTESGVTNTVAGSHDLQQAANYYYRDVESGPAELAGYRATDGAPGTRGSGCDDVGSTNVLRIETGDRRIAYELTTDGDAASLDRHTCVRVGGAWAEESVLNIADALDASDVVTATVVPDAADPTLVDRVVLFLSEDGRSSLMSDRELVATPRTEVAVVPAPPTSPECPDDPLAAAERFQTFVEGDLHVSGSQIKQTLAVGGTLTFDGNVSVGQNLNNPNQFPRPSGLGNAALLVGRVGWPETAAFGNGTITLHSGSDAAFADFGQSAVASQGQNLTVYEAGDANRSPSIKVQNGGTVLQNVSPVDFEAAFDELRACSDLLAELPASCGCGAHVGLTDVNGNTYQGTAANNSVKLALAPGTVNVLNLTVDQLDDLADVKWASTFPSATSPLIVNVVGGPDVTFDAPQVQGAGSTASYILWNFPNATGRLTITGNGSGVWGTVMAPYADVVSSVSIEGGVIASSFTFSGSSINPSRSFAGEVPWD